MLMDLYECCSNRISLNRKLRSPKLVSAWQCPGAQTELQEGTVNYVWSRRIELGCTEPWPLNTFGDELKHQLQPRPLCPTSLPDLKSHSHAPKPREKPGLKIGGSYNSKEATKSGMRCSTVTYECDGQVSDIFCLYVVHRLFHYILRHKVKKGVLNLNACEYQNMSYEMLP